MATVDVPPRPVDGDRDDRSPSPPRKSRSPRRANRPPRRDAGDSYRPEPKKRITPPAPTEEEKQAAAKKEYEKLLTMRSGGTYIPPARLRALQAQITDKTSKEYQRMAWEALKKSINGLINKVNTSNIKHIVPELFNENLIRGSGLFCRSMMKAQAASLPFTPIYAAMVAVVNSRLPQVGELLVKRLVMQFRKAFKRNDKTVCRSSTTFIAHLINQHVVHEMLAAQMLLLLLHKPTDESVELAVNLTREVGAHMAEMNPPIATAVFDQFRNILYEADIDKRVQYMIEVLFQVRKDNFKDNPAIKEELDLVEDEDQITHQVDLDGEIDVKDGLNIFKYDPNWEQSEASWKKVKAEILGEESDEDDDEDDEDDSSEEEEDEGEKAQEIKDQSNTDLVNLRRTIYLTIMSSMDPEECVHKLMKINLPHGQEPELPSMIVECCSQEKTYSKFFGLIGERFAKINRLWTDLFEQSFAKYYETIHRYETNRLRNIARFFGHMFGSDAFGWHVLSNIHLNEEETTSSSRIFIKILFQDIAEEIGMPKLQQRMRDEELRPALTGLFPRDNPRNIRFSINYFTSIGMGALTEEMREYLQNMPKPAPPPAEDSDSDSVSSSSYTGSSYSRSPSPSRSRSPVRRAARNYSESRSRSPARSQSRSYSRSRSRTPPRRRARSYSRSESPYSRSPSPLPRGRRNDSYSPAPRDRGRRYSSYSRSPTPRRSYSADSRSQSRSRTPVATTARGRRADSRDSYSRSRSRSSTPKRGRAGSYSHSRSPPPRGRRESSQYSRSRSRSPLPSRSPSPPAVHPSRAANIPVRQRPGGGYSRSRSRTRSPPRRGGHKGMGRRRRYSESESDDGGPRKKRIRA